MIRRDCVLTLYWKEGARIFPLIILITDRVRIMLVSFRLPSAFPVTPFVFLCLLCCGPQFLSAQRVEVETREVVTDLKVPWEITWGPDDWLWVAERAGHVSRIHPETGERHVLLNLNVFNHQESGLYGLVYHPNFVDSPFVFINYSYQIQDPEGWYYNQRVVRYEYSAELDSLVNDVILIDSMPSSYFHNGGRMMMLPDRTIMLTYGDQGDQSRSAQNHDSLPGKILRMDINGQAPPDNPFPTYEYPQNLIYSLGHRNPQSLVRLPDGRIYSTEHSTDQNDELNMIQKKGNYGWPRVEGFCDGFPSWERPDFCVDSNVIEPVYTFYRGWVMTVAPCGMGYYDGPFEPWKGSLLLATTKNGLMQLKLDSGTGDVIETNRYFATAFDFREFGRFRDVCISPDGRIFIGTSNQDGRAPSGFPVEGDDRILELIPRVAEGNYVNAQPIGTWSGCAGGTFDVEIETGGQFGVDNVFRVEVSDASGEFTGGERVVNTLVDPVNRAFFKASLPPDMEPGDGYKVRLVSTDPPLVSEASIETFEILAAPPKPVISREDGDLVISGGNNIQWFRADTTPVDGATGLRYTPTEEGDYLVALYNADGCRTLSDPFTFSTTSVPFVALEERVAIELRDDKIVIVQRDGARIAMQVTLSDLGGSMLYSDYSASASDRVVVPLAGLPSGMYAVRVVAGGEVLTRVLPLVK